MKSVTVKGYYQLLERLFQQDKRVNSFVLGDVFDQDEGNLNYTTVILQPIDIRPILVNGQIVMNEYRVSLLCLGLRLKDKSNTQDVLSETANILTDSLTRLLQADEYFNLQIDIQENNIQLENLYVKGNDLALGHSMTFSFQAPYFLDNCDFDFDALSSAPTTTCEAVLVQNSDGTYSVEVASGGSLILSDVTIENQDGQTASFPYSGSMYTNFTGGSSSVSFSVLSSTGGTLYALTTGDTSVISIQDSNVSNSDLSYSEDVVSQEDLILPDVKVFNSAGSVLSWGAFPAAVAITAPDFAFTNTDGVLILNNQIHPVNGRYVIPNFDIINQDGQSANTPYSGSVYVNFTGDSAQSDIENTAGQSLSSVTIGAGSTATTVIGDSLVQNSNGSYQVNVPATSGHTLPDINILDGDGNALQTYPSATAYTISNFNIVNQDGQSASSIVYSGTVHTNFTGSTGSSEPTALIYQRPKWRGQTTSYATGDIGWQYQSGATKYTPTGNTVQTLDFNSSDPFYTVTENNIFGSNYRFTDMDGNAPNDGLIQFSTSHWLTGGTKWCVIDHLTGLLWFQPNIGTSMTNWDSYVSSGHSFSWSGITDWRLISIDDFYSVLNVNSVYYASGNIFKRDDYSGGADTSVIFSNTYLQSSTQNFYGTSAFDIRRAAKTTSYNSTYGAYVCKEYLF